MRVKICGITNLKDAEAAVQYGADALGFVFASSPRQVTPVQARAIVKKVGPFVSTVGVFVNETPEKIIQTMIECGLSAAQLHGDENALVTRKLSSFKVIKAFRVDASFRFSQLKGFESVDAYLFDTKVKDLFGGSGKAFDWKLLSAARIRKSFILSGGLHPRNVKEAVRTLRPYAVDVSSGVEQSAGKKDLKKMKEFIRNAKNAV